ncbi:hypothetical protein NKI54_27825 [Mesorhizobium sp. M0663]|uniref:hypothetical protein n=1 Tax=Mesorhizobium sp. M0663 TaxID=2956981 RepID=UPI00333BB4A4
MFVPLCYHFEMATLCAAPKSVDQKLPPARPLYVRDTDCGRPSHSGRLHATVPAGGMHVNREIGMIHLIADDKSRLSF